MKIKNITLILSLLSLVSATPLRKSNNNKNRITPILEGDEVNENIIKSHKGNPPKKIPNKTTSTLKSNNTGNEVIDINENLLPEDIEECLTPECYDISKRIITSLDPSVDPCQDFYKFSCGGWINEHPIPKGQSYVDGFLITKLENWETMRELLRGDYEVDETLTVKEKEFDEETFNKLKNVYNTCMDVDAINKKGNKPILEILEKFNIQGIKRSLKTVDGLTNLLINLHTNAVPAIFDMGNLYLNDFSDNYILVILENVAGLSKDIYKYRSVMTRYKKYIKDTLTLVFKGETTTRNIDTITNAIVSVEEKLSSITSLDDFEKVYDINEYKKNQITVAELNKKYPFINWKIYFTKLFEIKKVKTPITDSTKIFNLSAEYFTRLSSVLNNIDADSLSYYFEWFIIKFFIEYASDDLKKPEMEFKIYLEGKIEKELPRDEFCINKIEEMMGMALGKYFVQKNFSEDLKKDAELTITYIKQAMINRIPQMKWLDDKTKEYAIKKVVKMTDNIGYPDYIMNPEKLSEDYEGFETTPNDYFTNMINFDSFSFGKNLKLFKQQYDNDRWHMTPQTINAYYYLLNNSMNFPAGIFQSPFYHSNDPDYLNYGSIGMVIGHELTHAFDNNGKNYDEDGKFSNWWSDSSLKKFEELSQCFINQYSKFYITDKYGRKYYVNGKNTLGENLADNGGLARAYEAWKISISKDPEHAVERNKALPGLSDYSYDQLFYISFGQGWCINATPEYVISKIENDVHSPAQFRVNGVVSNSEHFAKTFNCQKNAPMNPNNKCLIW